MDIKLILYILIIVAWTLFSNYRKHQQKKRREEEFQSSEDVPNQPEKEQKRNTLEELLRELEQSEQTRKATTERTPKYVPAKENPPIQQRKAVPVYETLEDFVDEYNVPSVTMKSKSQKQGKPTKNVIQESDFESQNEGESHEDPIEFDLKKAIIYSEILKRPYS
jgi:hypothetical protein